MLFTSPYYVQLMDEVTIIHSLLSCGTIRVHHILLRLESGDHLHHFLSLDRRMHFHVGGFFLFFFSVRVPWVSIRLVK